MKAVVRKRLAFLLLFLGTSVMSDDTPRVLFEFTGADAAKEWQTVNDGVNPTEVNAVGFLLGDKKAGPFELEVEWIKVVRAAPAK